MRLGEGGKYVDDGRKGNFIAIGWAEIGDLSWTRIAGASTDKRLNDLIGSLEQRFQGNLSKSSVSVKVAQLIRFASGEIRKNDLVVVPDSGRRKFLVARITGDYEFREKWADSCPYSHRRSVEWIKDVDRGEVSEKLRNSLGAILTLWSLQRHGDELEGLLKDVKTPGISRMVTGKELLTTIVKRLGEMDWREFQKMAADLLDAIGFQPNPITRFVGDQGVDVVGTLNAEGIANVTLRVQVKRVNSNIGINEVQRIRGTLGKEDHGAIIAVAGFTKQALEEAQREDRIPIALIDGERLAELLLAHYDEIDEQYKRIMRVSKKEVPVSERFVTELEK
jgi:predicted Mrr-cat superfamily restriction endonuclease